MKHTVSCYVAKGVKWGLPKMGLGVLFILVSGFVFWLGVTFYETVRDEGWSSLWVDLGRATLSMGIMFTFFGVIHLLGKAYEWSVNKTKDC